MPTLMQRAQAGVSIVRSAGTAARHKITHEVSTVAVPAVATVRRIAASPTAPTDRGGELATVPNTSRPLPFVLDPLNLGGAVEPTARKAVEATKAAAKGIADLAPDLSEVGKTARFGIGLFAAVQLVLGLVVVAVVVGAGAWFLGPGLLAGRKALERVVD